jgi:hypothetical protein
VNDQSPSRTPASPRPAPRSRTTEGESWVRTPAPACTPVSPASGNEAHPSARNRVWWKGRTQSRAAPAHPRSAASPTTAAPFRWARKGPPSDRVRMPRISPEAPWSASSPRSSGACAVTRIPAAGSRGDSTQRLARAESSSEPARRVVAPSLRRSCGCSPTEASRPGRRPALSSSWGSESQSPAPKRVTEKGDALSSRPRIFPGKASSTRRGRSLSRLWKSVWAAASRGARGRSTPRTAPRVQRGVRDSTRGSSGTGSLGNRGRIPMGPGFRPGRGSRYGENRR